MRKINYLIVCLLVVAACNNNEKKNDSTDSLIVDESTSSASTSSVKAGKYVNLTTGEDVYIIADSVSGLAVDSVTLIPVEFYYDPVSRDTLYQTGMPVNNMLIKEKDGKYRLDDTKIKIDGDEIKIKTDSSKLKIDGEDMKAKSPDGKTKIDEEEIKIKP